MKNRMLGSGTALLQLLDPDDRAVSQRNRFYRDHAEEEEEDHNWQDYDDEEKVAEEQLHPQPKEQDEDYDAAEKEEELDEEAAEYVYNRERSAVDLASLLEVPPPPSSDKDKHGRRRRNSSNCRNNPTADQHLYAECRSLQDHHLALLKQRYGSQAVCVSSVSEDSRLLCLSFTDAKYPHVGLKVELELGGGYPLLEAVPRSINVASQHKDDSSVASNHFTISKKEAAALVKTLARAWPNRASPSSCSSPAFSSSPSASSPSASPSFSSELLDVARISENWLSIFAERKANECVAASLVKKKKEDTPQPTNQLPAVIERLVASKQGSLTMEQRLQKELSVRYDTVSAEQLKELQKAMAQKLKQHQDEHIYLECIRQVDNNVVRSLRSQCLLNMARNLLHYESLEGVPLFIRTRIFGLLMQHYILHPLHLALLLEDDDVKKLDLSPQAPHITDEHLHVISLRCRNLRNLNLRQCAAITDEGLASICSTCHQLAKIDLQDCKLITSRGISSLADDCPNLVSVNLSNVPFEGHFAIEKLIRRCDRLQVLQLAGTQTCARTLIRLLQSSRNIRFVDVSNCGEPQMTTVEIPPMTSCKAVQLETLYMNKTKWATLSLLKTIFKFKYPLLQHVSLKGLPQCDSLNPELIFSNLCLHNINLAGNRIGPGVVRCIADNLFGTLRTLNLSGSASRIQTASVEYLMNRCFLLEDLKVKSTSVSGLCILKAAVKHRSLTSLDITNTNDMVGGIIDSKLNYRVPLYNKLRRLKAKSCPWMVDFYMIDLVSKCFPCLKELNIGRCPVTEQGLLPVLLRYQLTSLNISHTDVTLRKALFYNEERAAVSSQENCKGKEKEKEEQQALDPACMLLGNLRVFSYKHSDRNAPSALLTVLPMYLPKLERLSLCFSNNSIHLTTALLDNLEQYSPNIRYLHLRSAVANEKSTLLPEQFNLPKLRHLRHIKLPPSWDNTFAAYFQNALKLRPRTKTSEPVSYDDESDEDEALDFFSFFD